MPVASGYFILAALAAIGVPGLASFWGELMVFIAAFRVYPVGGVLAVAAGCNPDDFEDLKHRTGCSWPPALHH